MSHSLALVGVVLYFLDDSDWSLFRTIGNAMESEHCHIFHGIE
jgi:hypothetical protein